MSSRKPLRPFGRLILTITCKFFNSGEFSRLINANYHISLFFLIDIVLWA